jgi:acetylornithine/N-succinyldiaminopimelate aminotransferase
MRGFFMDNLNKKSLFLKHIAQTSPNPLMFEIEKAEGIYLYDKSGKKYLDLISGIGVSNLGHGNADVINAIKKQSDHYLHLMVYGEFIQSPQVELATKLCELFPENLSSVYYVNSGSEAIEGAMKLSKRFTGRHEIIALQNAYHGSTHGPLSLSSNTYFTDKYAPLLPGIRKIRQNNFEDLSYITNQTAGVFIETIMGEAGYLPPDIKWLKAVKYQCEQTGALLVFDEIQCGMGRTGKLFAFEHYRVIPDILVLAKAFGAGMPIGAFISSKNMMQTLSNNPILGHITTFGGHPVCAAAAYAGLNFMCENKLWEKANQIEYLFRKHLSAQYFPEISGKGAMLALKFKNEELNFRFISKCIEQGLLLDWFLYASDKTRLAPPLIISENQIMEVCEMMNNIAKQIHE